MVGGLEDQTEPFFFFFSEDVMRYDGMCISLAGFGMANCLAAWEVLFLTTLRLKTRCERSIC